jgi:hypothetical protein
MCIGCRGRRDASACLPPSNPTPTPGADELQRQAAARAAGDASAAPSVHRRGGEADQNGGASPLSTSGGRLVGPGAASSPGLARHCPRDSPASLAPLLMLPCVDSSARWPAPPLPSLAPPAARATSAATGLQVWQLSAAPGQSRVDWALDKASSLLLVMAHADAAVKATMCSKDGLQSLLDCLQRLQPPHLVKVGFGRALAFCATGAWGGAARALS